MTIDEEVVNRTYQYKHGDRPLEGYTIQRAAGRGGFGEVYYALSDSGREVALKLVMTYEQIELRGISQCMNIKSSQLVTIFDVKYGTDGRPWVIMEYVAGPSLRELLDAAPSGLGATKAAFFLREIGKGLTYLHNCGIVHRDLKPGNIFYEDGVVKIGDYGLSKAMSMTQHSGQTIAVGTLHYMAPEIGQGHYDRTIDIYALGALLYEMITGRVPFFGSSPAEVLMKHLTSDVSLDGIEEPFQSVIRRAMAKNPADRFQSVQEMVEAVFGTEHVRESVSQFSPASLTQVAGRAANNKGARPFIPPRAPTPSKDPFERAAESFGRAGERFREAGERIAEKGWGAGRKQRWWRSNRRGFDEVKEQPWDAFRRASGPVGPDPLNHGTRIFLSMLPIALAASVAAIGDNPRNGPLNVLFVVTGILGTMIGAKVAWKVIGSKLQSESKWVQRLALGAPAALGLALFSFPFSVAGVRHRLPASLEVCFISAMLIEWEKRISPDRKERLSVGHLFTSGICAFVLAGMLDDNQPLTAIATIVGASAALSLCNMWGQRKDETPLTPQQAATESPLPRSPATPPPIPTTPMSPAPIPSAATAFSPLPWPRAAKPSRFAGIRGLSVLFFVLIIVWFSQVRTVIRSGSGIPPIVVSHSTLPILAIAIFATMYAATRSFRGSVAAPTGSAPGDMVSEGSSLGRFTTSVARSVVGLAGAIFLVISMFLALSITVNVPGLFASGVLDSQLPHQLAMTFGTLQWPRLMIECATAAYLITSIVSILLLLLARRHGGGWHVIRTVIAVIVLLSAVIALGRALPNLAYVTPAATPGDTADLYFQQVQFPEAVKASVVFLLGAVLMGWPARPYPRMQLVQPAVAVSKEGVP